jgi:hypothetical protein
LKYWNGWHAIWFSMASIFARIAIERGAKVGVRVNSLFEWHFANAVL